MYEDEYDPYDYYDVGYDDPYVYEDPTPDYELFERAQLDLDNDFGDEYIDVDREYQEAELDETDDVSPDTANHYPDFVDGDPNF